MLPFKVPAGHRAELDLTQGTEDIHLVETIDIGGKICPLSQVMMDHCMTGKQPPWYHIHIGKGNGQWERRNI